MIRGAFAKKRFSMTTSSTVLDSPLVAELGARYGFREPAAVVAFLHDHAYLVPLLNEAADQIARHFGAETPVVLEVVVDREAEDQRELFALIQADLPFADAKRRLDDLDASWWLEALERARCNLTIDVEFRPASDSV